MMTAATTPGERLLGGVISADQFQRSDIEAVLERATALESVRDDALRSRIAATLFYEPSTRTRLSFESAMLRRGGSVIGTESAAESSSAAKGETLDDTIRVVSSYADVIILRHPDVGAARSAARVATVPIINAGDGAGEHPTQALLDLFCIYRDHGGIDGLEIALCGDLRNGRTVHSLVRLLTRFDGISLTLVAPDGVRLDPADVAAARAAGVRVREETSLDDVIESANVVYQTRVQRERFASPAEYEAARAIRIDMATVSCMRSDATIMHPLPRIDEIATEVDADPRAAYFRQAAGGVAVRMALLEMVIQ